MTPAYKDIEQTERTNKTSVVSDTAAWEDRFEAIPGVSRIQENDFTRLGQLLAPCEDADSYLTSPTYYSFTGRYGLWVYEKGDAFLFVCWHPNVPGEILIFPQLVQTETDLVANLLSLIPEPAGDVRIARIKSTNAEEIRVLRSGSRRITLEKQEENVLDWKYPVRILSTAHVASLSGHKFMKIRNHIRQLTKHSVEVMPFDAIRHSRALENLLHRWADYNAKNRAEYDLLYAPYETLFSQSLENPLGLSGQMIFVEGQLQSVGLWDVSNNHRKTANVYVNFCNTEIGGLSELSTVKCCETLHDHGIAYVNLGGSETDSLDSYKRKFDPIVSIDLCTIAAKISTVGLRISEFASKSDGSFPNEASDVGYTGFPT